MPPVAWSVSLPSCALPHPPPFHHRSCATIAIHTGGTQPRVSPPVWGHSPAQQPVPAMPLRLPPARSGLQLRVHLAH
eukprot:669429-Rhodomonas_salina.4